MKAKVLIIILVAFMIAIAAYVFYIGSRRNITVGFKSSDFELKNFTTDQNGACYWPTRALEEKCRNAGGVLSSKTTRVGFDTASSFNCFPTEITADAGKPCKKDVDCQGLCLWLAGDIVTSSSTSTCSSFKKPLFGALSSPDRPICRDYVDAQNGGGNFPMSVGEFDVRGTTPGSQCLWPKSELEERCRVAGGRLTIDPVHVKNGNFFYERLGCYAYGVTADAGKACTFNTDCEGDCVSSNASGARPACSSLKNPLFGFARQPKKYEICSDYINSKLTEVL
jgi:hypothetical protein